jgi:hypothetical protein
LPPLLIRRDFRHVELGIHEQREFERPPDDQHILFRENYFYSAAQAMKASATMEAMKDKARAILAIGTPSAVFPRGGVVSLLKTFTSIKPSPIFVVPQYAGATVSRQNIGCHA